MPVNLFQAESRAKGQFQLLLNGITLFNPLIEMQYFILKLNYINMKILKPIIYVLLVAALGVGGYFAWQFYVRAKTPVLDALYSIPNDAALIIGFNDYQSFNSQLQEDNLIWQDIRNTENLEESKSSLDSLLNDLNKDTKFNSILNDPKTKMYISLHFAGHNKFEVAYSLSLPLALDNSIIEDYLKQKKYTINTSKVEKEIIYQIGDKTSKESIYLTQIGGVITASHKRMLVEKFIISAHSAEPNKQGLKKQMLKMAGKDIAANVYVNYSYLYRLISKYASSDYTEEIKSLRNFSQQAVLDLQIKNNLINLSGFSIQTDSFQSFISSFQNSQPTEIRVSNILPASTSFMYFQGGENLSELLKRRSNSPFSERNEKALLKLKARYLVNMGDYFYPWIRNEIAFALSKTRSSDQSEGAYAIIEATDIKEAKQTLHKLSKTISNINNLTLDTNRTIYRAYEIHHIPLNNLIPKLFGKMYRNIENSYYTAIDNYIVFANSQLALQNIIDSYLIEQVLSNSEVYKNVLEGLSSEANLMIYSNLHYLRPILNNYLSKEGIKLINQSGLAFESFGSLAMEFIANDEGVYSTFVLQHGGQQEVDEPISWKTALDNPIARGPFWIKNHKTNQQEILVFDKEKLMYRIDQNGSIAWAIPIPEYPMSKIYLVDYYKNGKYQYMFNSKNYLYLFDLNGNRVENFPVKLPKEASAGMTLVDYDNNKNYRILIPMTNGKVYNFKIDGSETQGWKYPSMKQPIHEAVQFFKLGTKDFLIISDTAGNVIYANRRGEARMNVQLSFTNNTNSLFYVKDGGKPAAIITTDLLGRIITIDNAGKVSKTLLHEFSANHHFYYFDFNDDKRKDYIFLDKNSLYVFNHRNKLILQKEFEQNVSNKIIGVQMATDESIKIILLDVDNQKILLISKTGQIISGEDYQSSKKFMIEEATKSHILRLITTYGRIVSSFLIK